jgi:TPR repeat
MEEVQVERRLAAILVADIAGDSCLMAEDEAATVTAIKGHQAVVLPRGAHPGHRGGRHPGGVPQRPASGRMCRRHSAHDGLNIAARIQALAYLEKACALDPTVPEIWTNLGVAYQRAALCGWSP